MTNSRNPTREIVLSLLAALVFAGALGAYLFHSIPSREELRIRMVEDAGSRAAVAAAESRGEAARLLGTQFVQSLAQSHAEQAYRLMATSYRNLVPLPSFRAQCQASPYLAGAQNVTLTTTRETIASSSSRAGAMSARGVLESSAGAVEVAFSFADDGSGPAIASVLVGGIPAVGMLPAPAASVASPRRSQ